MKSLSTIDTSIRLCLEQMSCRDKGGYKQNNTSAGSHPSIWLWYQDEKHENGATGRPHVKTSPIWYGIEVRQFSNGFSVDFMKGIPYQNCIKNIKKIVPFRRSKKNTEKKKRKDVMNMYTSYWETYIDVPCKVFESPTTVNLRTFIRRNKRKIASICEMNQPNHMTRSKYNWNLISSR